MLSSTEFGLSETEILEIVMPTNDITDVASLEEGQFNFATLAAAKCVLGDLLLEKQMSGKMLLLWRHSLIKDTAKKAYAVHQDILKAAHAEVANLFFLEFTKNEEKSAGGQGKSRLRVPPPSPIYKERIAVLLRVS